MEDSKKKILIITYYWPPAGGPGVQRWLKFCTYLPKYNIHPVVYTAATPNYPTIDTNLLTQIPENITVIKRPILEPYSFAACFSKKAKIISQGIISEKTSSLPERILLWIRGNIFIPDARVFWVRPSIRFLKAYIQQHNIDTVITTGPPHSLHLIGKALKCKLNIIWIADFRDPWTTIGYHSKLKLSTYAAKKHQRLEREVLGSCNQIIVTSNLTKQEFLKKTSVPITVITNGYEPCTPKTSSLTETFSFTHAGTLLTERNPKLLWEVLSELCVEIKTFSSDLELRFAGRISESILKELKSYNLISRTTLLGYVSHEDVRELQQKSQVLLLIEANSKENRAIIPGKLFEYLDARRPILAIGPQLWEAVEIITNTHSGDGFNYTEKNKLKTHLKELYKRFKAGELITSSTGIETYTRESVTKKLSEMILS